MSKTSWLRMFNSFFFPQQQNRSQRRRWHFPFWKLKGSPPLPQPPTPPQRVLLPQIKSVQSLAAIKIQAVYRGYLARKASGALKGIVKLQAIIRGQLVRQQAMSTLKCLEAIVSIQSQVCNKRNQKVVDKYKNLSLKGLHHHILEREINKHTIRMDDGLLQKDEEIENIIRKKEDILRRQNTKPYSSVQKVSTDSSEDARTDEQLRYLLKKYVNEQVLKQKNTNGLNNLSLPRRSFHTGPTATTPTYMAPTKSAKAKTRSTSPPRPRSVLVNRGYSDGEYSPYKHRLSLRLSPMSSTTSEMTFGKHKSPSFKGVSRLVLSTNN